MNPHYASGRMPGAAPEIQLSNPSCGLTSIDARGGALGQRRGGAVSLTSASPTARASWGGALVGGRGRSRALGETASCSCSRRGPHPSRIRGPTGPRFCCRGSWPRRRGRGLGGPVPETTSFWSPFRTHATLVVPGTWNPSSSDGLGTSFAVGPRGESDVGIIASLHRRCGIAGG